MVSWTSDGSIAAYSGVTRRLAQNVYLLASPGTVDVNGVTRLQYAIPSKAGNSSFPNRMQARIPMTFTPADFTANPGKKLSVGMFVVKATDFPEGKVPTPAEILALGEAKVRVYRSSWYWSSLGSPTSRDFFIEGPAPGTLPNNTKHWALVTPIAFTDPNSPWTLANAQPMNGPALNTIGRAISLWSNRTPSAPTITSPPTGTVANPGDTLNLSFTVTGNDVVGPSDADRANLDLAGVQFQYAPVPTQSNPSPEWAPLRLVAGDGSQLPVSVVRGDSGPRYEDRLDVLLNLGAEVLCGADDAAAGQIPLPSGEWQIRCRVADFGHPYPTQVLPLDGRSTGEFDMDNYPVTNKSLWSEPIRVVIPTQVPPPIPIKPTSNIAVQEGETVRLSWLYRNTNQPPFPQAERLVRIRRVGDPNWSNVFGGPSSASFVDLPPAIDNPTPTPPSEYLTDVGFEAGTLGGWTIAPPEFDGGTDGSETVTNTVGAPPSSHSGSRHLLLSYGGVGSPGFYRVVPLTLSHDVFTFSGWIGLSNDMLAYSASVGWLDSGGNIIEAAEPSASTFALQPDGGWPDQWVQVNLGEVVKPPAAVSLIVYIVGISGVPSYPGLRLDDVSVIGSDSYSLDDFTLEATTWYEWEVQVRDTDGETSNFSESARFWVVPAGGTGEVRPVPTETIDGATLGCGTHRVFVYRRGGLTRVGELTSLSHVDWSRLRDDISTAKVVVSDWDIDCGNLLSVLEPWAYELVIFRDNGYSVDRVWEGPITLLTYEESSVSIQAKDMMGYAYRRIIKQQMNDAGSGNGTTVVDRAARVLRNTFAPDDPNVLAYLTVIDREDDAMQYRSTPAYSRTAFEEVDDMAANAGLDYTCVGRAILLWGTKHRIGTLPEFQDRDLGSPPIVSVYGMSMANRYVVSDGNGVWGEATRLDVSGNDEKYGLVEMLSSTWATDSTEDVGTYTQEGLATVIESFEEFAERSISDRYPVPVVVRVPDNTTLNPETVLSIQQLVPGVVIPLRSTGTLRSIVASQKLDSVRVVEESGNEVISITMSPFSRDDMVSGGEVEE